MSNLFNIFEEKSLRALFDLYPDITKINTIAWCPSCGYDYRHIQSDLLSGNWEPKLYIHTDIFALNHHHENFNDENHLFKKEKFISQYNTAVTCLDFLELKLKNNFYHPSYEILYNDFDVHGKYNGKVFCFLTNIGYSETRIVPIIFAAFENTNFFYDYILDSDIKINELIHINDGGQSMGSSKFKMDYIYLYLDKLGVQKIKLDFSLETKLEHAVSDFGHFKYFNPLR